ncbi:cation diffusion facilitator family transporter [Falsirhodobacter algicola]|uniref:Cation diffusion facilitator family transporter n=1 Tax=Falsirhodobacter algicola TaxID=2692330 RepID=A0A8J8SLN7_9RHOB|nr:cation diffusion facilitator family transporter [Falsirhodobacter algicola]QUS36672.1 cation diffusion facilitator family transporter [Falsirhodobacter algicola]
MRDAARLAMRTGAASCIVAAVLVGLKLWAVAETGALSIAASLADSAIDLMVSLGAMTAIIYAQRPADEDHAFGHSSAEDIAALAQAVFIAVSALVIAAAAVMRLLADAPPPLADERQGIAVMTISILMTLALVWWQGHVARRTGNRVIAADRLHYLGDLVPNIGAIVALVAAGPLGLPQIDSVVALAAAVMMLIGAAGIGRGAFDALMDRQADPEVLEGIATLAAAWPGVRGFHDLKSRTAGSRIFINLHLELDGDLSLREAHDIGAGLKRTILLAYPQTDVIIHKDVAEESR